MKRSNSFGWMKLFISFQVVIMSWGVTAMCSSFGWMFTPQWLVGNLHDLSPEVVWFTRHGEKHVLRYSVEKRLKKKVRVRETTRRWEEGVWCNYVSLQWQVWITNFNSRAMKMIWSGLNCKETAAGMVMKICWDDVLCLRIHQTCLLRWKASVIHSVG